MTKEERKQYNKEYREENKQSTKERHKKYYESNKETIKEKKKIYQKERMKNDPLYKLSISTRGIIRNSLRNNGYTKKSRTQEILGCSFDEFKSYLESKFEPWMNWQNPGNWNGPPTELNTSWDIDHIIPLSSGNTEEELIKLNHYTNLQPLCSFVNRYIKRDNY